MDCGVGLFYPGPYCVKGQDYGLFFGPSWFPCCCHQFHKECTYKGWSYNGIKGYRGIPFSHSLFPFPFSLFPFPFPSSFPPSPFPLSRVSTPSSPSLPHLHPLSPSPVLFCLCSTVANGFMLIFMKRVLSVTSKTTPTPLNDETNPNNPNNPTSNTPINPINPINPTPSSPINNNNNNNNNNNDLEDPTLALPPLKFEKFDFLFYQSINCAAVLGLFALLLEGKDLIGMLSGDEAWSIIRVLANSSFMSIFYQLSLIGLVKNTTPLSKEVISQSKIVPQTVLAIVLFNEHYSSTTILGLFVAVCGLALYSYVTMSEDKKVITTKTPTKHNE
eukprot:TRINITY_DN2727_c0_g2_i2.p1 TRINITY_DN2727_c0_g2~~TRINITY_DN2727_c0_g2_i2.p1  ORF type:complete len:331 (+),score=49.69 TRINITY_DN2727_c0_g2_i2:631-1623(+)